MNIETQNRCCYPVGSDIQAAKEMVKEWICIFNTLGYSTDIKINLWCRGSSGAILAALFASMSSYNCIICHVKKEGEISHSDTPSMYSSSRYTIINVVIDDFISSGATIREIVKNISFYELIPPTLDVLIATGATDRFNKLFKHTIG